jgi:hypothetical protein
MVMGRVGLLSMLLSNKKSFLGYPKNAILRDILLHHFIKEKWNVVVEGREYGSTPNQRFAHFRGGNPNHKWHLDDHK